MHKTQLCPVCMPAASVPEFFWDQQKKLDDLWFRKDGTLAIQRMSKSNYLRPCSTRELTNATVLANKLLVQAIKRR